MRKAQLRAFACAYQARVEVIQARQRPAFYGSALSSQHLPGIRLPCLARGAVPTVDAGASEKKSAVGRIPHVIPDLDTGRCGDLASYLPQGGGKGGCCEVLRLPGLKEGRHEEKEAGIP